VRRLGGNFFSKFRGTGPKKSRTKHNKTKHSHTHNKVIGKKGKRKQKMKIIILTVCLCLVAGCAIFSLLMQVLFKSENKENDLGINNTSILETATDYQGHWAEEQIVSLVSQGLMTGTSSVTLEPDGKVTRAQFVIMLYKLDNGKLPIINNQIILYEDVLDNFYYTDAINWASSNKLVHGISKSEFIPNYLVTRQQALTVLYEYFHKVKDNGINYKNFSLPYSDKNEIADYAEIGVRWASANNIIDFWGYDKIEPANELTRAELATIIYNYIEKFGRN
jgi:hypothetical protein